MRIILPEVRQYPELQGDLSNWHWCLMHRAAEALGLSSSQFMERFGPLSKDGHDGWTVFYDGSTAINMQLKALIEAIRSDEEAGDFSTIHQVWLPRGFIEDALMWGRHYQRVEIVELEIPENELPRSMALRDQNAARLSSKLHGRVLGITHLTGRDNWYALQVAYTS
jgi:hypothetical protein